MKLLVSAWFILSLGSSFADEFTDTFTALKKADDAAAIEKFLEKSATTEADNPNYYATAGNYWWGVAGMVTITQLKEGKFDLDTQTLTIRDPETGKAVGAIKTAGEADPEIPLKAIRILSQGAKKFPQRADIAMGLAYLQKEVNLRDGFVETLVALLAQAKKDPQSLQWMNNEPLPEPVNTFLPESIQDYSVALFNANSPQTDVLCGKLLSSIIDAFPDHPYAYNLKAALADANGKPAEALGFLKTAHEKAPKDVLILSNLAETYAKAGEKDAAISAYKSLLELKLDPTRQKEAEAALKELER